MTGKLIPLASLTILLSACASGGAGPGSAKGPGARAPLRVPASAPPPRPRVLAAPGLDGVIGARFSEVVDQFGPARLEVWEGDARKLQFTGSACVLDVARRKVLESRTRGFRALTKRTRPA